MLERKPRCLQDECRRLGFSEIMRRWGCDLECTDQERCYYYFEGKFLRPSGRGIVDLAGRRGRKASSVSPAEGDES